MVTFRAGLGALVVSPVAADDSPVAVVYASRAAAAATQNPEHTKGKNVMRKLGMVLRVAVASMLSHKLRSFLTMLGIIIGVAAVIALVAVGQGAQQQVVSQFQSLGSNLLTVTTEQNFTFSRDGA